MVRPVALLALLGTLAAAANLPIATFALGSGTFPLAFALPGVLGSRMLLDSRPTIQTALICLAALACNLGLDAISSTVQIAMLGLG